MQPAKNKYFDVVINNDAYYIVERSSKPHRRNSAIATLQKIETILTRNLTYSPNSSSDGYSDFSNEKLVTVLRKKSKQIHRGYTKKQSKLNWILRKFFSKEKKVATLHNRISYFIDKLQLAHKCGYKSNDCNGAFKFLKALFEQISTLDNRTKLPRGVVSYDSINGKRTLNTENTLKNFKNFKTNQVFYLYVHRLKEFNEFFNYLLAIKDNWEVTEVKTDHIKEYGSRALSLAIREGNEEIVELLLKHAADCKDALAVACCDDFRDSGIYQPPKPSVQMIKLLLQYKASPDVQNKLNKYPLLSVLEKEWIDIAKLLIENGAKIDQTEIDSLLKKLDTQSCSKELEDLLLKLNANPSIEMEEILLP